MLFSHSLDLEDAQAARMLLNSLLKNLNTRIDYFILADFNNTINSSYDG